MNKIETLLVKLNPEFVSLMTSIEAAITKLNHGKSKQSALTFSQNQTLLITYADQFADAEGRHFLPLDQFMQQDLEGCLSYVHLLPFYPWTSDDGFAPINYHEVCGDYGTWEDIEKLKAHKMFDCVFNHVSSQNEYFKRALQGDDEAQEMFHIYSQQEYETKSFQEDVARVVRPRQTPLFTPFTFQGELKYVWTTFGPDQVDVNLNNKQMMKYILDSFFLYIERGAKFFRIDAVPFMWKELGTNCSHLDKTHLFVKLLRAIIDEVHDSLYLVTESNVPHAENVTYWGNGNDEAHLIYNFSLAPLIIHAIDFATNQYLNEWGQRVFQGAPTTTYLNFTATHDGIGLRGLEGIVPQVDIIHLCQWAKERGGQVSHKKSRDGTIRPYELNITWASMMFKEELDEETYLDKLVNSHAIVMFFPGIAAHYAHNFLGTKNWQEGFETSGMARRLNRKKLSYPIDYDDFSRQVKNRLVELTQFKNSCPCFAPGASIKFLALHHKVLIFERAVAEQKVTVFFNLSDQSQTVEGRLLKPYQLQFKEHQSSQSSS